MQVLFAGGVHVHYGQVYVQSGWEIPSDPLTAAFAGQQNGLCGAATRGFLFMVTGLHTGRVGFTVERHDLRPPVDDSWEDVVEVSFRPTADEVALVQWGGEAAWRLAFEPADFRVRYSAYGINRARQADTILDGEPELDRYLLQFWPAPPGPDAVLKQSSANAAYWHQFARQLPPVPSPEEKAERERQTELERQEKAWRFEVELSWGGVPPSERLRTVRGNVLGLVRLDRPLVDAIAETDPETHREIARWAVHSAYDRAGLSSLDWVRPALDALDRGEALPPPFDDERRVWDLLLGEDVELHAVVASATDPAPGIWPPAAAVPAIFGAVQPEPLRAALDAVFAATVTFGDDHRRFLWDLRESFPTLGG
jgi:hypothetical protein